MNSEPSIPLSINDWREELSKERRKIDELTVHIKNQERNYQKLVAELKTQLQAEQQKSLSLENSLSNLPKTMNQISDLQSQLKQSEIKQRSIQDDFKHKIAEVQMQEKEKLALDYTKDLNAFKEYAMAEITEKEKVIIEQKLFIEKSESTIQSLSQELDYLQSMIVAEKEKFRIEIEEYKEKLEDLEDELEEIKKNKEETRHSYAKYQDQVNNTEVTNDENRNLKLFIKNIQEELELKAADLKNAEKKIESLRESRQDLANTITKLENKIETLTAQKQEIIKGLANKEETIQLLEEEIHSNAEDLLEKNKAELEEANARSKRLEKKLREMEQSYEDQLEEKLGVIATGQIRINDLTRKIDLLEKDKKNLSEKLLESQKKSGEYEKKLAEYDKEQVKQIESFKEKFKDRILSLKRERDDLRLKINELQELNSFNRPSIIDSGGSLFDEFAQLPEGRYSRISLKPAPAEDTKKIGELITQLAEKETNLKNLLTDKSSLETKLKESFTESKNLKQELTLTIRYSEKLSQELEMAKWELESLKSDQDSKLDKGKILVLESEKELLKAEISRLETQLLLSKENWAEHNNSLYKDLLESQTTVAQAKSEVIRIKEENDLLKAFKDNTMHKKKRSIGSWFKRET